MGLETEYAAAIVNGAGHLIAAPSQTAAWMVRYPPPAGDGQQRSNRFLSNGGRFYGDIGGHPEWATPECASASEAALYDSAGDRLMLSAAEVVDRWLGAGLRLYRNNVDIAGTSFGCHENFQVPRSLNLQWLCDQLAGHLVSRVVYTGAGRMQRIRASRRPPFTLTHRADATVIVASSSTTRQRPMINTRDEPHTDATLWRRLHVIVGDTNRMPWATWMKLATTDLVLTLIERRPDVALPQIGQGAPRAGVAISDGAGLDTAVKLTDGRTMTALEMQFCYLEAVDRHLSRQLGDEQTQTLKAWADDLDDLESDPMRTVGRVDWATKRWLFDRLSAWHGYVDGAPELVEADFAYHLIGDGTLFDRLDRAGKVVRLHTDDEIARAAAVPPQTRASLRGRLVDAAEEAGWPLRAEWQFIDAGDAGKIKLKDPHQTDNAAVDAIIADIPQAIARQEAARAARQAREPEPAPPPGMTRTTRQMTHIW